MWYFQPHNESSLKFRFENVLKEVDINEEESLKRYIANLPQNKRKSFHQTVCKDWIKTHCVDGDHCEYLHQCDIDKMPECFFWHKFGECSSKFECIFRHGMTELVDTPCKFYVRGFCKHGDKCKRKHVAKGTVCLNYLAGFCPDGPNCVLPHPKWVEDSNEDNR